MAGGMPSPPQQPGTPDVRPLSCSVVPNSYLPPAQLSSFLLPLLYEPSYRQLQIPLQQGLAHHHILAQTALTCPSYPLS